MTSSSTSSVAANALHILHSPDGYYTYLGITKYTNPVNSASTGTKQDDKTINDKSKIEKNYRKASLRLHPDRPGGDEEAFRILERAKNVLLSEKLRKEYDMLGLDLDEDDVDNDHHEDEDESDSGNGDDGEKRDGKKSGTETVIGQMASSTVAAILQLAVRTAMMAATTLIITRYKYLMYPAMLFLLYTSFQIFKARQTMGASGPVTLYDVISPIIISFGIFCMYFGQRMGGETDEVVDTESNSVVILSWSKTFWIGESVVMSMFCLNTLASREATTLRPTLPIGFGCYVVFSIIALFIRGKGWRYVALLGMEMGLALFAVLAFPIMEMILEEVMNEKLRKVGERVRAYSKIMNDNYMSRLEEMELKLEAEKSKNIGGGRSGGDGSSSASRHRAARQTNLDEVD
jgi:hypothetical protein